MLRYALALGFIFGLYSLFYDHATHTPPIAMICLCINTLVAKWQPTSIHTSTHTHTHTHSHSHTQWHTYTHTHSGTHTHTHKNTHPFNINIQVSVLIVAPTPFISPPSFSGLPETSSSTVAWQSLFLGTYRLRMHSTLLRSSPHWSTLTMTGTLMVNHLVIVNPKEDIASCSMLNVCCKNHVSC